MKPALSTRVCTQKGGFILVAVVIVIMLASMVVVTLLFRLRAEETATSAGSVPSKPGMWQ